MKLSHILALALALAFSTTASAQWQWVDKDGKKIFSDRAPPADVPEKSILRRPAGASRAAAPAPAAEPAAAAPAAASAPRPAGSAPALAGKDKDLMEKKKQADAAEAAKRKEAEEKLAKDRAENCVRAKRSVDDLKSGQRMSVTNDKGEREVMSDTQRAAEVKRLEGIVASDCKQG